MSHLKSEHSGKSVTTSSPTIAFRFRSGDDELEELKIEDDDGTGSQNDPILLGEDANSDHSTSETTPVKEYWNLLGKRSTSMDSGSESPFPNSDPWRKFNELKGKLTKTVEEKISEIKIERNKSGNVLGISSSRGRLVNSKDNSSISDSEDTSESSKLSESLKESTEENTSPSKKKLKSDAVACLIDTVLENIKSEQPTSSDEAKNHCRLSDIVKLSEIKISTAKTDSDENQQMPAGGEEIEVESGIEAEENFISGARQGENRLVSNGTEEFDSRNYPRGATRGNPQMEPPPAGRSPLNRLAKVVNLASTKKTDLVALLAAMILYHVFPLSPYLKGLVTGMVIMLAGSYIYGLVTKHLGFQKNREDYVPDGPFKIPIYEWLKPLTVPRQIVSTTKGVWFNEYMKEYDPDMYSVTQTVPVYIEIKDCYLKLSRPKGKINKRATYDEPEYKLIFLNHRLYNISGCSVVLLPEGLTKKRLYSKKYPIVIMLKPDSLVTEKAKDGPDPAAADEECDPEDTETDDTLSQSHESAYGRLYLNLFARCDRQKEEWYQKLLAASKMKFTPDKPEKQTWSIDFEKIEQSSPDADESCEPSTPFESVYFDEGEAKYEEYLRYMTQFVEFQSQRPEIFPLKNLKAPVSFFKRLLKKKRASVQVSNETSPLFPTPEPSQTRTVPRKISTSRSWPTRGKSTDEEAGGGEDPSSQSATGTQWLNAFVNRILFDVFRSPYWLEQIRIKMQKKLNSIRMPFYIEDIEIVELDLGKMGPKFHRISPPVLDDRGLWFDMDATFDGLVKVTIQTQLNLIKLQKGMEQVGEEEETTTLPPPPAMPDKPQEMQTYKKSKKQVKIKIEKKILWDDVLDKRVPLDGIQEVEEPNPETQKEFSDTKTILGPTELDRDKCIAQLVDIAFNEDEIPEICERSPMYDSELEDSAESSDEDEDEEDEASQSSTTTEGVSESIPADKKHVPMRKSSKKIFRIFENVAQSKYFKSVAQSKYVQKAIAGVSRTKLKLSLEIKGCVGTIAVNIPPPPSDRLWYGFREMPKVWLSAQPKIGEKHVRISHVKNFLEKKIMQEFKEKLVLPNMINLILPLLIRDPVPFFTFQSKTQIRYMKVMVFPNMDDVILPIYPQIFNAIPASIRQQATHSLIPDLTAPSVEITAT